MGFSFSFLSIGILWNLSSKDSLKEKLARESLAELTERVLIPLSGGGESGVIQQSQSETDIFYNTTGCLRYTHKHNVQLSTNVCVLLVPGILLNILYFTYKTANELYSAL